MESSEEDEEEGQGESAGSFSLPASIQAGLWRLGGEVFLIDF